MKSYVSAVGDEDREITRGSLKIEITDKYNGFEKSLLILYPQVDEILKAPPLIDDQFIRDWMSADEIFRGINGRGVGWPLLTDLDLYTMIMYFKHAEFSTSMPIARYYHWDVQRDKPDAKWMESLLTLRNWILEFERHAVLRVIREILVLGRGHLIVAGGAVTHFLQGQERNNWILCPNDFDFFFIGLGSHEEDKANQILDDVLRHLYSLGESNKGELDYGHVFCSQKCLTITTPFNCNLQFIFRLYPDTGDRLTNISLPIGGFDLHSCACAISLNPETQAVHFHATPAAAFSLGTNTNVLMTSRNSTSMVPRLSKYLFRGFEILFPGTSVEKMNERSYPNRIETALGKHNLHIILPHLTIYDEGKPKSSPADSSEKSDYSDDSTLYYLKSSNTLALLQEKPDRFIVRIPVGKFLEKAVKPHMIPSEKTAYMVDSYVASLRQMREDLTFRGVSNLMEWKRLIKKTRRFLETVIKDRLAQNPRAFPKFNDYARALDEIQGLESTLATAGSSLGEYVVKTLKTKLDALRKDLPVILSQTIRDIVTDIVVVPSNDGYVARLREFVPELYLKAEETAWRLAERPLVPWNSSNPLTQHTASNNPTITNAREWWGPENYIPFRVGFPNEIFFILKCASRQYLGDYGLETLRKVLMPYVVRAWAENIVERQLFLARERLPVYLQRLEMMRTHAAACHREMLDLHHGPPASLKELLPVDLPLEIEAMIEDVNVEIAVSSKMRGRRDAGRIVRAVAEALVPEAPENDEDEDDPEELSEEEETSDEE